MYNPQKNATDIRLTTYAGMTFAVLVILAVIVPLLINTVAGMRTAGVAL